MAGAGVLCICLAPDLFEATARFWVGMDPPTRPAATNASSFDPFWFQHQIEDVIQSTQVLYAVISDLDLQRKWADRLKKPGQMEMGTACDLLKRQVFVTVPRSTSLVDFRARSPDPREAADIANAIAKAYAEARLRLWREQGNKQPPPSPLVEIVEPAEVPLHGAKTSVLFGLLSVPLKQTTRLFYFGLALIAAGVLSAVFGWVVRRTLYGAPA